MKSSYKIIAVIVIILIVAFFVYWFDTRTQEVANNTTQTEQELNTITANAQSTETTSANPTPVTTFKYKDGTYNVVAEYMSPGGKDGLGVGISIKDDKVTNVVVKNMANDNTSENFQNKFISGIKSVVLGKDIDSLTVRAVSGASLTSGAFNNALKEIKAEAKI